MVENSAAFAAAYPGVSGVAGQWSGALNNTGETVILRAANGAEIDEAVAMASLTRHMSTLLNGAQVDPAQFREDIARLVKGAQTASTAKK